MTIAPRRFRPSSASLVFALRLLLLLAAATLAVVGVVIGLRGESGSRKEIAAARYVCPMHPEVVGEADGQCPICKMALEPAAVAKTETKTDPRAPEKPRAGRPGTSYAASVPWLPETSPPAHAGMPHDGPAIAAPKRRVFTDEVRAVAWLESPDRLTALLYRDELIGLSSGERAKFFVGRAPRAPVEARRSDETPEPWDASTTLVRFRVEARQTSKPPAGGVPGDSEAALRAGDVGWLEIPAKSRELLVFPESALLRGRNGPYVLVPGADGHTFTRRAVEIGRTLKGHVVVLSGLGENDRLVIGGAFFIDAQQRLAFETGAKTDGAR